MDLEIEKKDGETEIVHNIVSFEKRGETVVVISPNGSSQNFDDAEVISGHGS